MNEHLSTRARTVVACLGIRQRARGVSYFLGEYRSTGDRRALAAAALHAGWLRERAERALREAQLDQAGVPHDERGNRESRLG